MPIDAKIESPTESSRARQSWLARCGLTLTNLSVRDKHVSEESPNRPVMTLADTSPKKRRRTSKSPLPSSRTPFKMAENQPLPNGKPAHLEPRDHFDLCLKEDHSPYAQARKQLLQDEGFLAWDFKARSSASKDEIRAGQILLAIREYERDVTFGNQASEAIPGPDTLDMGGQFLTNRTRIESRSILYDISTKVPKGALLHLHFNAELHPARLLEEAQKMPNMFIRSIRPLLTEEDLDVTEMVFNVMPEDTANANIFSEDYKGKDGNWRDPEIAPQIWMRWSDFRKEFPKRFKGIYKQKEEDLLSEGHKPNSSQQGFVKLDPAENWLKSKMVLSEDEAYRPSQTVNGVWARFNQATRCFKGLLNYEQVYRWYISELIDRMIEEKVMYAELRPMLMDKSIPTNDGRGKLNNAEQMQMIIDGVNAKKAELVDAKKGHLFPFGLKIVYCTPRSIPKPKMISEMKDCIDLKLQFPDLICGFDLVGAEDRPNNIGFYYDELVAFKQTCKDKGLDIPFLFHAGETLLDTGGSKDPANSNLYDAVLLQSKRIGHGFSLMKHPHLVEKFRRTDEQKGICVELCPISNELLHLCRNVKEHPYPELLAAGIPCTVNSDNPSLFSNSMSHEFYQIMVGAPTITIHSWKQLALWSLEYSCLSEQERKEGAELLLDSWEQFCRDVVKDYERLMDGDKINVEEAHKAYEAKHSTKKP
ncbi:Metallo-dependent hydrolase [Aaosphaeria arxii CBS 175.79]|uniref:Metallo-dependent hydrolase n=1 Tax=Aaosphaeria arxii CBS 175.79 TaxID=1450172 RepID=A0A6A5XEJ5_9PLEO|nr:Metallo-dependent hydrolase [Aaosphaeria arxii CBS 175.79]KAF2011323.1 Metallo-dependent hydrolase [Aaosphaeria arxii CBS 175.79]